MIDRTKLPEEIAVLVDGVGGGTHAVIVSIDGQCYLLHIDEHHLPEVKNICILIPTYERPVWFSEGDSDIGLYSFYNTPNTLITWRIKRREINETTN